MNRCHCRRYSQRITKAIGMHQAGVSPTKKPHGVLRPLPLGFCLKAEIGLTWACGAVAAWPRLTE